MRQGIEINFVDSQSLNVGSFDINKNTKQTIDIFFRIPFRKFPLLWNAYRERESVRIEQISPRALLGESSTRSLSAINLGQRAGTLVKRDFDQGRIRLLSRSWKTSVAHLFYFRAPYNIIIENK